jgi:hypothetical protein
LGILLAFHPAGLAAPLTGRVFIISPAGSERFALVFACRDFEGVRDACPRAGLSQERLARDLGVDRGNLAIQERGRHTPGLYTIVRLLPGLGVTFVEFCRTFERILKQSPPRAKKQQLFRRRA